MTVKIRVAQDQLVAEKVKSKAKVKGELTAEEQAKVDEYYHLSEKLKAVQPLLKAQEDLKKVLASVAADEKRFDRDQPALLKGDEGVVEFGPMTKGREIEDMHGLIGLLKKKLGGYEQLLQFLKINLSDVDKYLSEAESAPFMGEKDCPRRFKSVRSRVE